MSSTTDTPKTSDGPKANSGPKANTRSQAQIIAQQARGGRRGGGFGGGRHGGGGMGEKAMNFFPSLKRLLRELGPQRVLLVLVIIIGAISVVSTIMGPKIMIHATNEIFAGFMSNKILSIATVCGFTIPSGTTLGDLTQLMSAMTQNFDPTTASQQCQAALGATGGGSVDMSQVTQMMSGMDQNRLLAGIDFGVVGHWLLIVGALYAGGALLSFLQGFWLARIVQRTVYNLREKISHKLDRLPLKYFDGQPRGELLSRVTNDIDNIQQSLQQTISQVLNAVMTVLGIGIMMFTISWELALITIAVVPVAAVVSALIGKRAQSRFVGMWTHTGELNAQVEEGFTGHAIVKVFGRRQQADEQFKATNEELFKSAFGANFLSMTLMPLNMFIGNINYVAVVLVGALKVTSGTLQLGDVTSFIQYSRQFTQPISQIASMANLMQSGVASAERVFEVLDQPEQTPDEHGTLPVPVQGHVQFEDVAFSYDPDHPLITDLSLEAKPGQTVAIVGETGAGKTTLVNLLMRFYDIQGGKILLDGVDTSSVPRDELRNQFGMVLQDTWLFSGTIKANIAYGGDDPTDEQVLDAAKTAYVDRFVHALPDGYDTVIDDEGSNISAGEKQLLTIARAFVHDPAVLILDEATSSVDTRTEVLVQQAMAKLRKGRTSFVIAHRLSTIRDADTIVVMEHGHIVEQGSHDHLLAAGGAYAKLYQSQFQAAGSDDADSPVEAPAPKPSMRGMGRMGR